jgi:hypothetical protein
MAKGGPTSAQRKAVGWGMSKVNNQKSGKKVKNTTPPPTKKG